MKDGLSCAHCGSASTLFPFDEDGMVWSEWEQICLECFHRNEIDVSDGIASVSADDDCLDVGQPRCDGSCGACEKWVKEDHPCCGDCVRLSPENRCALIAAAKSFNEENRIVPYE